MNPNNLYPVENFKNTIFLKPLIEKSEVENIHVGEYSYYSDFKDPTKFLEENVLYNFGFSGTSLHIGKFCAFADGVKIIMADANHATEGITTFPFAIFGGKWSDELPITDYPFKKYDDIVIGNDVWLGKSVTVLPGVKIGNGAIVGSHAVVAKDIPPYSIAVGNPAKVIKQRFSEEKIAILEQLNWWDWPVKHIDQNITSLVKGDMDTIIDYAKKNHLME
ncbi:CatB-related O-acetyltransferase [Flammeovirga sp. SR4]|uniref:CatB-related O-acetyltransferase n=1 Tax=Flammeovirga agarivorans TaxID=2726742 RepID=A0A7X8SP71_9BACT|nr:CatB-related O-acetyltransferase [Flammeovirga agarivorans]